MGRQILGGCAGTAEPLALRRRPTSSHPTYVCTGDKAGWARHAAGERSISVSGSIALGSTVIVLTLGAHICGDPGMEVQFRRLRIFGEGHALVEPLRNFRARCIPRGATDGSGERRAGVALALKWTGWDGTAPTGEKKFSVRRRLRCARAATSLSAAGVHASPGLPIRGPRRGPLTAQRTKRAALPKASDLPPTQSISQAQRTADSSSLFGRHATEPRAHRRPLGPAVGTTPLGRLRLSARAVGLEPAGGTADLSARDVFGGRRRGHPVMSLPKMVRAMTHFRISLAPS